MSKSFYSAKLKAVYKGGIWAYIKYETLSQSGRLSIKIEFKRLILGYKKVIQSEIVLTSHWFV